MGGSNDDADSTVGKKNVGEEWKALSRCGSRGATSPTYFALGIWCGLGVAAEGSVAGGFASATARLLVGRAGAGLRRIEVM